MRHVFILFGLVCTLAMTHAAVKQPPRIIKPGAHRIGQLIDDVSFRTIDGKTGRLSDFKDAHAVVIAFTGVGCPLTKKFAPELAAVEDELSMQKVTFIYVNPTESDDPQEQLAMARKHGFDGPVIHDVKGTFGRALGVLTTTDVFVLDKARTLVYRGAVSDQYGIGFNNNAATNHYLKDAVAAALKNERPTTQATWAPGCALDFEEPKQLVADITYHNRISRIIQANCLECHRRGGVAPFSLTTYKDVVGNAAMIRSVVNDGLMPPWFAEPVEGVEHAWANDRSLSAADKRDLVAWLKSDKPAGDPKDAPLVQAFPTEWNIGKPDVIIPLPRKVAIKATGQMPYVNLMVKTDFKEDRWVTATEIRPTFAEVVHHVLVFVIPKGEKRKNLNREDRGFLAAYVPGNTYREWGDGWAKRLPAGATLHFQMHYTPNGTAVQDQTELGLNFAKETPQHVIQIASLSNHKFRIPPRDPNYSAKQRLYVPTDVEVMSFLPHMHLRGKAFRYDVIDPNGARSTLLDVPEYDFNWQLQYRYNTPRLIKGGSTIEAIAWWDNSAANPANPDPNKTVKWGDQTDEEMLVGYVEYYVPGAGIGGTIKGETPRRGNSPGPAAGTGELAARFRSVDHNDDGILTPRELTDRPLFTALDTSGDGKITLPEAEQAMKDFTDNFRPQSLRTRAGRDYVMELFRRLDANRDNRLTRKEVPQVLLERLGAADLNGDEEVTKTELEDVLQGRRRRR